MSRQSLGGERRHIIFSKPQDDRLTKTAKETGISFSEHVRRAVDTYFRVLDLAKKRDKK